MYKVKKKNLLYKSIQICWLWILYNSIEINFDQESYEK